MDRNYFTAMYAPFIRQTSRSGEGVVGSLQLPEWEKWNLAVPVFTEDRQSSDELGRLVWLQNMVAGKLSHDKEAAKRYLEGKLLYYEIVEEIETFFACERLC